MATESGASWRKWAVLVACWLVTFSASYLQYQLSNFAPDIMANLAIDPSQYSVLVMSPTVPSILFGVAGGLASDKYGPKAVVLAGICVALLGAVGKVFLYEAYWPLVACMFLTGFAPTLAGVNASKLFGGWFGPQVMTAMGIYSTSGTLAQFFSMATTARLFSDQRSAYVAAAALFVVTLVAWALLVKNPPAENAVASPEGGRPSGGLGDVVRSKSVWLVILSIMAIMACTFTLSTFLTTVLTQLKGLDMGTAGTIAGLLGLGNMFGALLGPVLARKMGTKGFMACASVISAVGAAFLWRVDSVPVLMAGMLVLGIALGCAMPLLLSSPVLIPEIGPSKAGVAAGFITTMQLLSAFTIPSFVLTPIAGENYALLFALAGACMLVMLVCGLLMPDFAKAGETA